MIRQPKKNIIAIVHPFDYVYSSAKFYYSGDVVRLFYFFTYFKSINLQKNMSGSGCKADVV
jgi:hypothetical protein